MISVVMGVYNGEKTVERAMRSVLDGTYRDIEFIAVNDGSTDGTAELLSKIAEEDTRVKVINSEKNFGLAHALNTGIRAAKGEFVARTDADDASAKNRLERELNALIEYGCDFVCCGANLICDGKWGERIFPEKVDKKTLISYNPFIHPTLLIKKEALIKVGGYCENADRRRVEDYDLFVRLYAAGFSGRNLPEILIDYYEPLDVSFRYDLKIRLNEYKVRKEAARLLRGGFLDRLKAVKPLLLLVIPKACYNKYRLKKWRVKNAR